MFIFFLIACNQEESTEQVTEEKPVEEETIEEEEGTNESDDEFNYDAYHYADVKERMLLDLESTPLSGDNYNESEVQELINQFPDNLEPEQYYDQMLSLIGEDYRTYYESLTNYDVSFKGPSGKPGDIESPDSTGLTPLNVSILFDASGSMNAQINGNTKMELAKDAVESFVSDLPDNVNISLTIYGHEGTGDNSDKELSCNSIDEIYPMGPYDEDEFGEALDSFAPAGWTPLADAIHKANEALNQSENQGYDNIVYVVSDGVETCDGDPVSAAKELTQSDIEAIVNIIGFDVDDEGQQQLRQVAEAGDGEYSTVRTEQELKRYFDEEKRRLINEWYSWQNENVNNYYTSQNERVNELYSIQNEMVNKAYTEQNRFINLSYHLEDTFDLELNDLRDKARDIGEELRSFARDLGTELREKLRDDGKELREDVREQGSNERDKLRNND